MATWEVLFTDEFGTWFEGLEGEQQDAVIARVELLESLGYVKAIPLADELFDEYLRDMCQQR